MIKRKLSDSIGSKLGKGKAIIIMGARQVGKTTLLRYLFEGRDDVLWLNGDDIDVRMLLENISASRMKAVIGNKKTVIIDEAQRIPDIGIRLKIIIDQIPDVQLVATGSSSFDLAGKINEPLTGRKWEYKMYPVSFGEMVSHHGLIGEKRMIPHRLVFGYYPDVINNPGEEKEILRQLSDSYLYKDLLIMEQIKKPERILKLLQALAFQIGSQVSYFELSRLTGLDSKTVEKYIGMLEQAYIIFRLGSFSRNLRNELSKSRKIYFLDNGIRNAVIADFSLTEGRKDIGALWENFIVSERRKYLDYTGKLNRTWYWRTKEQKEIDFIEESDGILSAFEFKWNPSARYRIPGAFLSAYPGTRFRTIDRDNFDEWLL
jgi:uncharacterized protein